MDLLQLLGWAAFAITGHRSIQNALYKVEPSLMFMSAVRGGERRIYQDTRINLASKMIGYSNGEKGGMMGLQTLVGFSRYKSMLEGSDYEVGENGEKIYSQKVSTVTHGINLKNIQMLEDLGYIKIDSMEEKFRQNFVEKALGREPRGLRMLLINEKLGFGNWGDLRKIAKAGLTGDKETLESMRKTFSKVTFRLTDKPIDFEELYKKSLDIKSIEDKKERMALRRLAIVFDSKAGILSTKNIDIGKDAFGRDVIKYGTKESFAARVNKTIPQEVTKSDNIRDRIKEDVDIQEVLQKHQEQERNEVIQNRDNGR